MEYNGFNTSLPVSPVDPNPNTYINSLPQNVPFTPQVNLQSQNQQQIAGACLGYFLLEIQNNARKNGMRCFTYNYLAQNSFQNNEFNQLFLLVVQFAEAILGTSNNVSIDQAAQQASSELAVIVTALYAKQWPELMQYGPRDTPQNIDRAMNRYQEINAMIDQYQRMLSGQQQNWNNQQSWNNQGWNNNSGYGGNGPANWNNGGMFQGQQNNFNRQFTPTSGYMAGGNNNNPPANRGPSAIESNRGMFASPAETAAAASQTPRFASTLTPRKRQVDPAESLDTMADQQPFAPSSNRPKFAQDNSAATVKPEPKPEAPVATGWNDNIKVKEGFRESDAVKMPDGGIGIPAKFSDMKVTWTPERPGSFAYDPTTHVMYHVMMPNGTVLEKLMTRDDDDLTTDYDRLETRPNLKGTLSKADDGLEIVPNDELLAKSVEVPTREVAHTVRQVKLEDIKSSQDTIGIPQTLWAASRCEAALEADLFLHEEGLTDQRKKHPIEYRFEEIRPIYNSKVNGTPIIEILEATFALTTVDEYVRQLKKLDEDPNFPDHVLAGMLQRSTDALNRALKGGLGLAKWAITATIMDDWFSLGDALVKSYGEEKAHAMVDVLEAKATRDIITGGFRVLTAEEAKPVFEKSGPLGRFAEYSEQIIVLAQFNTQTSVPWRAANVSLVLENGQGAVSPSKLPKLYGAIEAIFERNKQSGEIRQRNYIRCSDNRYFELLHGFFNDKHYVIREIAGLDT